DIVYSVFKIIESWLIDRAAGILSRRATVATTFSSRAKKIKQEAKYQATQPLFFSSELFRVASLKKSQLQGIKDDVSDCEVGSSLYNKENSFR
ncbi:unnamed protein product, partial [Oikopleura dioica]